jgi:hypothetical protein
VTEMPSENDVLETKKKRFSVLNTIYDFAGQDEEQPINTYEIKNKTKIEGKDLYNILKFLANYQRCQRRGFSCLGKSY